MAARQFHLQNQKRLRDNQLWGRNPAPPPCLGYTNIYYLIIIIIIIKKKRQAALYHKGGLLRPSAVLFGLQQRREQIRGGWGGAVHQGLRRGVAQEGGESGRGRALPPRPHLAGLLRQVQTRQPKPAVLGRLGHADRALGSEDGKTGRHGHLGPTRLRRGNRPLLVVYTHGKLEGV